MQTDTKGGNGHHAGPNKRHHSELHRGHEKHSRMDEYDGGTTYRYNRSFSGTKQAGEIKSEENWRDQTESRGGYADDKERA
eukprot:230617-Heterocapsa_arctica.AAC.1